MPCIGHTSPPGLLRQPPPGGGPAGRPGGLAPGTVRQIHVILREALRHAVQWQILGRNVADAVEPPRAARPSPTVWTDEQARAFLALTEGAPEYALWFAFLATGLRLVRKLVELRGQLHFEEVAKTGAGQRPVALDDAAVAMLAAHRDRQGARRRWLGGAWRDEDLMFSNGAFGRSPDGPSVDHAPAPRVMSPISWLQTRLLSAGETSGAVSAPGIQHD